MSIRAYSGAACKSQAAKIVLFISTEPPQAYSGQALKRSFATLVSADVCGKVSISVPRESYNTTVATRKAKVKDWTPRYLAFPMKSYTERGGIAMMDAASEVAEYFACK